MNRSRRHVAVIETVLDALYQEGKTYTGLEKNVFDFLMELKQLTPKESAVIARYVADVWLMLDMDELKVTDCIIPYITGFMMHKEVSA